MEKIESVCNQFKKDTGKNPNVFYLGRKEFEMFRASWPLYVHDYDSGINYKMNVILVDQESYIGVGITDDTAKEPGIMETKDLKARKRQLEHDIETAVYNLIKGFASETGIYPRTINMEMMETGCMGLIEAMNALSCVRVELEI